MKNDSADEFGDCPILSYKIWNDHSRFIVEKDIIWVSLKL